MNCKCVKQTLLPLVTALIKWPLCRATPLPLKGFELGLSNPEIVIRPDYGYSLEVDLSIVGICNNFWPLETDISAY